jgi:hypothetical protein
MSTGQRPQIDAGKVRAVERLGSHRPRFGFAVIARLQHPSACKLMSRRTKSMAGLVRYRTITRLHCVKLREGDTWSRVKLTGFSPNLFWL